MTHLEFLRSPEALRILDRAATGAGVPLSMHYVERNQEGTRLCGWGQCTACRAVTESPGGTTACRLSRTTASTMAIRQHRPIAYVCHLGFACVAVAPFRDEGYVITLGPYCPMEEQRSLEADVQAGFAALPDGAALEDVAVALEDIHRMPAASVPALAEWLQESLAMAWAAAATTVGQGEKAVPENVEAPPVHRRDSHRSPVTDRSTILAQSLSAALSAGSHARARALLQAHVDELSTGADRNLEVRHAHLASVMAATLEALERAGISAASGWANYEAYVRTLPTLKTDGALLDASVGIFSFMRRSVAREEQTASLPNYPELFKVVKANLCDGVTLESVAAELKETPSAISHRLKRKFGMSFSDYVGRLRIDMAKELIRRTELSATEVALRVGIGDQSNFAKLFKKFEGVSPSAYRKAHGKGK